MIVIVVIVLLSLTLHPGPSSSKSAAVVYGEPISAPQATGPAEAAQATQKGGPWTPSALEGWGAPVSQSGTSGSVTNCTTVWSNSSTVVVDATPADASPGELGFWVLYSLNAGGDLLLTDVFEANGTVHASNGLEVTGSCASTYSTALGLPADLANSTTVAATANAAGGATFLTDHPGAWQLFTAIGDLWTVLYTSCSLYAPSGTGAIFTGFFNGTTGASTLTPVTETVPCSSA